MDRIPSNLGKSLMSQIATSRAISAALRRGRLAARLASEALAFQYSLNTAHQRP